MIIIGIDPGRDGGIAVFEHGKFKYVDPMPLNISKEVDVWAVYEFLERQRNQFHKDNIRVFLEQTNAFFKASAKSMYSFGRQVMAVEAPVICLGLSYETVRPAKWMKEILVGYPKKTPTDKPSLRYVEKKYPGVCLIPKGCRKPKDGMSDAICIAEFGIKKVNQKESLI